MTSPWRSSSMALLVGHDRSELGLVEQRQRPGAHDDPRPDPRYAEGHGRVVVENGGAAAEGLAGQQVDQAPVRGPCHHDAPRGGTEDEARHDGEIRRQGETERVGHAQSTERVARRDARDEPPHASGEPGVVTRHRHAQPGADAREQRGSLRVPARAPPPPGVPRRPSAPVPRPCSPVRPARPPGGPEPPPWRRGSRRHLGRCVERLAQDLRLARRDRLRESHQDGVAIRGAAEVLEHE